MKEGIDIDVVREIESMTYNRALKTSIDLIESSNTKPDRKEALLRDLREAPDSKELSRIMWNVVLAGEGLSIVGSKWQKTFGKSQ